MEFLYKVKDMSGQVRESSARADNAQLLRARLSARGYEVIEIKERGFSLTQIPFYTEVDNALALLEPISLRDMVVFSRQFAAMISAGVPLLRTLSIIVEQCKNRKLKGCLEDVRRSVESGLSLSDALARSPAVFDKLYVSMVRAGEAGGFLSEVLKRLADFLEARQKLNQKVKSAMVYPTVVLAIAVLVFWVMLTFILPIFEGLFKNIGTDLPAYTRFLMNLSEYMRSIWMALFAVCVAIGVFFLRRYYRTEAGREHIDGIFLNLPLFGDLSRKVAIARFCRTFGTLIKAGVPMLSALDVVKDTAGNASIARSVEKIYNEVRQGGSISKPMAKISLFPTMVTQMVAVGEETGNLDEMLTKVAEFYDMEVDNAVESLTSMLEPIMVVGIGGIVGSVVVGMYLPIFTVIEQLR
ncbi:MAG: type II secretion system F family protein [Candidatus Melainabacteria bacterium]|jgi:type IV pilus assembly protein PilC|nr:type II secretion system F family protein [Candidatus Melainabacteria bacterium]